MSYKLSAVLYGHKADVRGLTVTHDNSIISCSRDQTAKLWKPNGFNAGYTESLTYHGHKKFVSSVYSMAPNSTYPNGLVFTGGNDNDILVFEPSSPTAIHTLKGHENTVCRITNGIESTSVLSASWDKTAKLWNFSESERRCVLTVSCHEAAVWAVLCISGKIITGSADKTIKVSSSLGSVEKTLRGHDDCVRDLAAINDTEILSCSNDATVRQWSIVTGECLNILYGHPNFVYSISIRGDLIASSGEDRCCMVWHRQKGDQQSITIPAQSVWTVVILPNSDVVTGSSDGVIRIFSQDPSRYATEEILESFENEVASMTQTAEKQLGGIKVSDLPGVESLTEPGTKDGQTRLVREDNEIICYSWSVADKKWNKMGNVVGGSGGSTETSGKVLYEGKEYDYVFNVDIEDDKGPLKLPYNKSEDPWFAAQAFIHKHNLPQGYLEQVAYFIINNSKQTQPIVQAPPPEFADPFTGGNRYIPGGSSSQAVRGADPFTGSNRYVPMEVSSCDTPVKNEFFPQTTYLRFDQANLKQILDKLTSFNNQVAEEFKLSESELTKVSKLGESNSSDFTPESIDLLKKLLNWPKEFIFPVLDILRLALRNNTANTALCCDKLTFGYLKDNLQSDSPIANQILSFRALCNMVGHKAGENLIIIQRDYLSEVIGNCSNLSNKSLQIAVVTLALNMCVVFHKNNDVESQSIILLNLLSILPEITDPEALFRALVTLGTILTQSRDLGSCVEKSLIEKYFLNNSDKVRQCSKCVLALLS